MVDRITGLTAAPRAGYLDSVLLSDYHQSLHSRTENVVFLSLGYLHQGPYRDQRTWEHDAVLEFVVEVVC
jgi:hypothetical protein